MKDAPLKLTAALFAAILTACLCVACAAGWDKDNGPYKITVAEGDEYIESCPTEAMSGEKVSIRTLDVADADMWVYVDGEKLERAGSGFLGWKFVMPDHDVTVSVEVEGYDFGA